MAERSVNFSLSIIVPALNEANIIAGQLQSLQRWRRQGCEVIVVDGGSVDDTVLLARPWADQLHISVKGRARQMNAGAQLAKGQWLLFLHADTTLPASMDLMQMLLACDRDWGFFPVRLDDGHYFFRCLEAAINCRSQLTSVATGDQCLFVRRQLFNNVQGFPCIELMEDVALSKKLRRFGRPLIGALPVVTSSRRWLKHGKIKTVLLMWYLRLLYVLGVSPRYLFKHYYG